MTISEARKVLGSSESKYSDEVLNEMMEKMRKLAELAYPIVVKKLENTP